MDDTINRQAAIDEIRKCRFVVDAIEKISELPPAGPEPLTDKEQRIFLKAIERELEICREIDNKSPDASKEISLVHICKEIERKVKSTLWS